MLSNKKYIYLNASYLTQQKSCHNMSVLKSLQFWLCKKYFSSFDCFVMLSLTIHKMLNVLLIQKLLKEL